MAEVHWDGREHVLCRLCRRVVGLSYPGRIIDECWRCTTEHEDFWASVERSAATVRDLPAWMKAGVAIDKERYDD